VRQSGSVSTIRQYPVGFWHLRLIPDQTGSAACAGGCRKLAHSRKKALVDAATSNADNYNICEQQTASKTHQ
jgi:hypothetical protein